MVSIESIMDTEEYREYLNSLSAEDVDQPCEGCPGSFPTGDCIGCPHEDPANQDLTEDQNIPLDSEPVTEPAPVETVDILKVQIPAEKYKEIINSLAALVTECRIHISPAGITCLSVDVANVAMVSLDLPRDWFDLYQCETTEEIGIDVAQLKKLSSMVKKGDQVSLEISGRPGIGPKNLHFEGAGNSLDIVTIDPNTVRRDPNRPNIELKVIGSLPAAPFMQGIADIKKIADKVTISTQDGAVLLQGDGDTTKIKKTLPWIAQCMTPEGARSLYSIEYMGDIAKTFNKKENVILSMGIDHPISMVRQDIGGVPGARIEYLLAPRIEGD